MKGTKYLSDLMPDTLTENTLVVAPTGAGKTHYVFNKLCKNKKTLYLCDTTNLKLQMLKEQGTSDILGVRDITVWTYSKFGREIKFTVEELVNQFNYIICDEVHNLIDYQNFSNDTNLERAMEYLVRKYEHTTIVFFTATPQYLNYTTSKYPCFGQNFNVIDFSDNDEIKRYSEGMIAYLAHLTDVKTYLTRYLSGFRTMNYKCLIFSPYIKNMQELERISGDLGLRPICIWSDNNKILMTYDQKRVKDHLLETGELLEPYNVLIINRATETGINIYDKDMKIMICNTENEVQQVQARGRIRHDVDLLVLKTSDLKQLEFSIDKEVIGIELTKESLIERVIVKNNMRDKNGKLIGIPTLRKRIEEYGYTITDRRTRINRRQVTVYKINKK